jgi:hypothetical protein
LQEGVVATAAATVWYVSLQQQQQQQQLQASCKAPLLAGHTAAITGLIPLPACHGTAAAAAANRGPVEDGVVASVSEQGWLALWGTGQQAQVHRRQQ